MRILIAIVISVAFALADDLEDMACNFIEKAWFHRNDQEKYMFYAEVAVQLFKNGANPLEVCRSESITVQGLSLYMWDTPYALAINLSVMPVIKFIFEDMKISPQQVYRKWWGAPINSLPCDIKVIQYFLNKGLDPNYIVRDVEGFSVVYPFLFPLLQTYRLPIAITNGQIRQEAANIVNESVRMYKGGEWSADEAYKYLGDQAKALKRSNMYKSAQKPKDKIRKQCREAIEFVLRKGGNPNMLISLKSGSTLLHLLEKKKDPYNVYKLLVKYGAKEDIKNKKGKTPRELYYRKNK